MKTHRLLLVNPANTWRRGFLLRNESRQAPLGLGIVAALTPSEWKIKIIDENFRKFRFQEADFVGITSFTSTIARAYEIADIYRSKGIPVVIGGIHASAMPDEAALHCDAVIVGEAETTWPQVIADFRAGNLQKIYRGSYGDMKQSPRPRHDLFHPGYYFASVQTSRGCPMDCEFCSVPAFNGHKYRLRDVNEILDELESLPHKLIYFVDDNIIGYGTTAEAHARTLFEGMIARGLKKEWFAQTSLNIAEKPDLLHLAARAGCRMMLIGIEAEKPAQLKDVNKKLNLKMGIDVYAKSFRAIHKAGIAILGAFIYGLDSDTADDVRQRTTYIKRSSVDVTQASILTPLPGTRLFETMKNTDRFLVSKFPEGWQHFHFTDVIFKPALMTPAELAQVVTESYDRLFTMSYLRFSFLRTWWNTRNLRTAVWAWNSNLNYRSIAREKHICSDYSQNSE
ncbi:MAG: B12-binding domain-containing radical SAM protein [Bacteroidetes bacterium HGW-Bacteroidetes-22]|nr:MAG: B12-binding domain-containing radical SAM protein [Bacteroidetes bacterium HGW-Bacteroidetes-22]